MSEPAPSHNLNQSDAMNDAAEYADLTPDVPLAEVVRLRDSPDALKPDEIVRLEALRSRADVAEAEVDRLKGEFNLLENNDGMLVDMNGGRGDAEGIRKVSSAEDTLHEATSAYMSDPLHDIYELGLDE